MKLYERKRGKKGCIDVAKRQKTGERGRKRPISRKGGQTPLKPSGGPKGGHLKGGHLKMGFRSEVRT